ncbi:MAG: 16S rRNA processing protein RimM [Myxococcales bacterium]|nr:16S rRNA processing protein RimM [Myxococcales bacterium]
MISPDTLVAVGVVIKPHGIRGEVRIHAHNLDSPLWDEAAPIVLRFPDGDREVEVQTLRIVPGKHLVARLAGVATREAAEALRGVEVLVPRARFEDLEEDEFYLVDLVGLRVQRDGLDVGVIEDVFEYPSVACLKVRSEDGVREVPIVEPWVVDVDVEGGVVEVGPWDDVPVQ